MPRAHPDRNSGNAMPANVPEMVLQLMQTILDDLRREEYRRPSSDPRHYTTATDVVREKDRTSPAAG